MAQGSGSAGRLAVAAAVVAIAVGAWWVLRDSAEPPGGATARPDDREAATALEEPPPPPPVPDPYEGRRIAAGGRFRIEADELPADEPIELALDVEDEARGEQARAVVIGSADGRRLETTAVPIPGPGLGVVVVVDPDFLRPGRYMIQMQTEEQHPLALRRYVLEVR